MKSTDAFFIGYFTEVQGFLLNSIRRNLADAGCERLPDDWRSLYQQRRAEVLKEVQSAKVGQAAILSELAMRPIASLDHAARALKADSYEVYFDPRERREDRELSKMLYDAAGEWDSIADSLRANETPVKIHVDYRSEEIPGLQISDILVGELRQVFWQIVAYYASTQVLDWY